MARIRNTTPSIGKFHHNRSRFLHVSARIETLPAMKDDMGILHPERNVVMRGVTFNYGHNAEKRSLRGGAALEPWRMQG